MVGWKLIEYFKESLFLFLIGLYNNLPVGRYLLWLQHFLTTDPHSIHNLYLLEDTDSQSTYNTTSFTFLLSVETPFLAFQTYWQISWGQMSTFPLHPHFLWFHSTADVGLDPYLISHVLCIIINVKNNM